MDIANLFKEDLSNFKKMKREDKVVFGGLFFVVFGFTLFLLVGMIGSIFTYLSTH